MSLTEKQVAGSVRSLLVKWKGRRKPVFGIRSQVPWSGAEEMTVDGQRCRVVQVNSPLQARQEVFGHRDERLLVLITGLSESALGSEVLARMAPPSLQTIHPWTNVKERFGAARLDSRVTQHPWLAEALLALPDDACKPVAGGVLDLNHALGAVLRGLGLPGAQPSGEDLMSWAESGMGEKGWADLSNVARSALRDMCRAGAGDLADRVIDAVEQGLGRDLVPVCLALDVLAVPQASVDPRAAAARVRSERYFGPGKMLAIETCRALADAARAHVERRGLDAHEPTIRRAETILTESLLAGDLVEWSDLLPGAVPLRQKALAVAFTKAVRTPSSATIDAAREAEHRLREHLRQIRGDHGALRADMALRLVRWLSTEPRAAATSLESAAHAYIDESVWVDRARHELLDGESHPDLRKVYGEILDKARARREAETAVFAARLADATETGAMPSGLIGIERILEDAVAPLAEKQRTLLVVLDGMSRANFLEIVHSIESERRFRRHLPQQLERWPAVLSVLPSVTEASRCSLLSGRVVVGGQAEETRGFETFARRKGWRTPAGEGLLFHRAYVMADNLGRMDGTLENAVLGEASVVAVVINAIDDQLAKGDQIRPVYGVGDIRPLERLIGHAQFSNRVVVLTCDHGHVVEEASRDPRTPGQSERWRTAESAAEPGEVLVRGSRVALPQLGGPCVLASSELVRYVSRHAGYHGGASPQEVLVSLAVLVPAGLALEGWKVEDDRRPSWWNDTTEVRELPVVSVPAAKAAERQLPGLFDAKPEAGQSGMKGIEALFTSAVFQSQKPLAGRSPLKDADLRALLAFLAERNWTATTSALASALAVNAVQLSARLSAARRLLNVEGYPVIDVDDGSSTVKVNVDLLAEQFAIRIQ